MGMHRLAEQTKNCGSIQLGDSIHGLEVTWKILYCPSRADSQGGNRKLQVVSDFLHLLHKIPGEIQPSLPCAVSTHPQDPNVGCPHGGKLGQLCLA